MPHAAKEPAGAWVVVWATFVCLALIFGVAYSFAAFFKSFALEFAAQRADVSLVFGLTGLIYFGFGALGGMLSDRFGPRLICGAGMVCIAIGLFSASFATTLFAVYMSYGVAIGFGIALVYTPAIGNVMPWFKERRGLASGIASSGIGLGTVLVPLLVTAAIAAMDWRSALRLMGAGLLVVGLIATGLLRRAPLASSANGQPINTPSGATLGEALRDSRFWWFYLFCVTAAPTMFIPFAHVSASARDSGINEASAVGLVGLIGVGSLIGRFAIGTLADRVGRIKTLTLAQVSMAATYLLWMAAGAYPVYPVFAIFALWFGLSYGGIVSLMPAICMDLFGARAVSGIIGTLYTGAALGNLLGPVVAGAVFDRFGSYHPVMWGSLALSIVAVMAMLRMMGAAKLVPAATQH